MRDNSEYEKYGIMDNPETERRRRRRNAWIAVISVLLVIVLAITAALCVKQYVLVSIPVKGESMLPTLNDGDLLYLNKVAKLKRGDIVVFVKTPATEFTPEEKYVKRVIGLSGDTVRIDGDSVYVNGTKLEESYINGVMRNAFLLEETVPDGYMFVLGDNRNDSSDSRSFGCVLQSRAIGKAFLVKRAADGSYNWLK